MEWFFALTTVLFASIAAYLSFKREKKTDIQKKEGSAAVERMHIIVHELRAPVTAIKGAASLLLSKRISEEDKDKMLHVIFDSAREMLSRISEILDSAKLAEGKFAIKKVKADLDVIMREHIDVFSYAAREKGITLVFEPAQIPQFYFDPGRIGQVINNLISNSLKFTKQQGKIEVKISMKKQEIEVEVADNGIGIPEDKKAVLFTKFGQISDMARAEESSGLGLFISRQIVEAHGGRIWIESKEGTGTHVFFTLPFSTSEE
jgi:signal transduction histidine kinase